MSRRVASNKCAYEWKVQLMSRYPYSATQPAKLANRVILLPNRPHRPAMTISFGSCAGSPEFGAPEDFAAGFDKTEGTTGEE
jgi:hypothetical protein